VEVTVKVGGGKSKSEDKPFVKDEVRRGGVSERRGGREWVMEAPGVPTGSANGRKERAG
jgi:hypothetical protein